MSREVLSKVVGVVVGVVIFTVAMAVASRMPEATGHLFAVLGGLASVIGGVIICDIVEGW